MSKSSLILNHRAGRQTSRRVARLASGGAVSQTGQDYRKRDQRQIASHRLLKANAIRRHCLRKVTRKDRSYVSEPMRPLLCSCGSTTRIEILCTISSIKALNSANHVPHGCISMRQSASGIVQMEQNLRGIMDKDVTNRLARAIARTHVDWIAVRGIEYNPLTSTYELKCMYRGSCVVTQARIKQRPSKRTVHPAGRASTDQLSAVSSASEKYHPVQSASRSSTNGYQWHRLF